MKNKKIKIKMLKIFIIAFIFLFINFKINKAFADWHSAAEHPAMQGDMQYHIRCKLGDINKYVLLPGDPARTDIIAQDWDESRFIAFNREHKSWSGIINYNNLKIPVSACSTGMGGPAASIAMEELAELGADTFIRVGSCGALNENINCGDLIICTGAMRQDKTADEFIDNSYPAMAHYEITEALIEACERLKLAYHVGVSCTAGTFYIGQARPGFKNFWQSKYDKKIKDLQAAKVLCFEMEAATVFTVASVYGLRAGAVFAVVANRVNDQFVYTGIDHSVKAANEALKILAERDELKRAHNKKFWYSSLGA